MVCLEVYSKCNSIKYKSLLCSKTTIFICFTKLVSIILPFVFAYNSGSFWTKNASFYEQPNVKYKHEYILLAETDNIDSPILCSNLIQFQDRIINYNFEKCSTIKTREIDHNYDGKYDELFFSVEINDSENLKIQSVTLILPLDYKLNSLCSMHMQTYAVIQYIHINPGIQMNFIGDISIVQRSPIPCYRQKIFTDYNFTLIDSNSFELLDFIEKHFKRNISIKIDHSYITWISGSVKTFTLNIHLKYSDQMIYYKPNFWQVMKFAWIQYLAVFVAIKWIINKIENYVFTNKLVLYYIEKTHMY